MMRWTNGLLACLMVAGLAGCNGSAVRLRNQGIRQFQTGRADQARDLLEQAYAKDPADPATLYYLGRTHHVLGEFEQAIFHYQSCLEERPGHVEARRYLARAMADMGPGAESLLFVPLEELPPPATREAGP